MDWFVQNKEWLLSGIVVAIPLAIIGWLLAKKGNKQIQKGGKESSNIQVGGDINIQNSERSEDD